MAEQNTVQNMKLLFHANASIALAVYGKYRSGQMIK